MPGASRLSSQAASGPLARHGDLARQRSLAKTGMVVSMGALAATGIMEGLGHRSATVRNLHVVSGLALMGFSMWHYSLYGSPARRV